MTVRGLRARGARLATGQQFVLTGGSVEVRLGGTDSATVIFDL